MAQFIKKNGMNRMEKNNICQIQDISKKLNIPTVLYMKPILQGITI